MPDNNILWGKIELTDSEYSLKLSDSQIITLSKKDNEVIIKTTADDEPRTTRYITGNEHSLFIEPGLPDLPIIIKPANSISVLPSRKLDVFIEIPYTIRILYGSDHKKNLLCEITVEQLSKSFFGNPENGEFAYFIESELFCCISEYTKVANSVYCPLTIVNKSQQNLEFEKMILRAPYLLIFQGKNKLIANPVNIIFRGQEQISQISYKKIPQIPGEEARLLTPARTEEDKSLLRKSFYFIKNLYEG